MTDGLREPEIGQPRGDDARRRQRMRREEIVVEERIGSGRGASQSIQRRVKEVIIIRQSEPQSSRSPEIVEVNLRKRSSDYSGQLYSLVGIVCACEKSAWPMFSSILLVTAVEVLDENSLKCLLSNDAAHDRCAKVFNLVLLDFLSQSD